LENFMPLDPPAPTLSARTLRIAGTVFVVIVLIVVIAGIATRTSDAARLHDRVDEQAVPSVRVISPGNAKSTPTLDLPGRLEAYYRASIYARVSGYLKSWKVDIGTPVKSGQVLAEIETPDLDQQLLQAKADLATAQANATLAETTSRRWQSLLATDSVARQEADEKAADFAAKKAMVNAAQANVDRYAALKGFTHITAPFDGVVTARQTDIGALINVGSGSGAGPELFVVSDTKKLRVYVNVPQSYATVVKRGTKAKMSVPERPGKSYEATVESLSQSVNVASGSMLIQLEVDNAKGELLPGGFATVSLELPHDLQKYSIPPSALIFDSAGTRVATVGPDNKVVLKSVAIARDLGATIEIASGIAPTDRIIESPPDGIANGEKVQVAEAKATTTPSAGGGRAGN
jgi:RND family efflux transporter MFP subunit